jgi:hypothetical protein
MKYGRAWPAKHRVLKLIYGDWAKAYKHLLAMLHAMKAKNPELCFEYVSKPDVMRPEGRQYSICTFWTFGQCVEAIKHCCDVFSMMGHS